MSLATTTHCQQLFNKKWVLKSSLHTDVEVLTGLTWYSSYEGFAGVCVQKTAHHNSSYHPWALIFIPPPLLQCSFSLGQEAGNS